MDEEGLCILCGENIEAGEDSIIAAQSSSLNPAHTDCFQEACGQDWFYPLERLAERLRRLEAAREAARTREAAR